MTSPYSPRIAGRLPAGEAGHTDQAASKPPMTTRLALLFTLLVVLLLGVATAYMSYSWRDVKGEAVIGGGINSGECQSRPKIEKREASRTPEAFRDLLLDLARNSRTVARVAA